MIISVLFASGVVLSTDEKAYVKLCTLIHGIGYTQILL